MKNLINEKLIGIFLRINCAKLNQVFEFLLILWVKFTWKYFWSENFYFSTKIFSQVFFFDFFVTVYSGAPLRFSHGSKFCKKLSFMQNCPYFFSQESIIIFSLIYFGQNCKDNFFLQIFHFLALRFKYFDFLRFKNL